jgi:hypothetical protein
VSAVGFGEGNRLALVLGAVRPCAEVKHYAHCSAWGVIDRGGGGGRVGVLRDNAT